jgi:hypothetical protein
MTPVVNLTGHTLPRHKHKHDACCQFDWSYVATSQAQT